MVGTLEIYGLDIETDTTINGLDPAVAAIVAAAVATRHGVTVFAGEEVDLLRDLDDHLRALPPGVIGTWNGASFDLPFLADRARRTGVALGLELAHDATVSHPHPPLAGHPGPYRARWYGHDHLDTYRLYRSDVGRLLGISCSLKSIAALVGLAAIEVDPARIHHLDPADLARYVASDAEITRLLAVRRASSAAPSLDQLATNDAT